MNYLVIDFGGTLVKYSVMNEQSEIRVQTEAPAPDGSREEFLDFICSLYRQYSEYGLGGIAVSMPGAIHAETGQIVSAGAYVHLYGMNLYRELKERLPVPISVENDGKCAALAEVWQGNLRDCADGIVLILGTGLAGGIIKNREVHKGKDMAAGEFSYILTGGEDDIRGSALMHLSVSALLFKACLKKGINVQRDVHYPLYSQVLDCSHQELSALDALPEYRNGMNGYQFFALLEAGDPEITQMYEEYTAGLARLVRNLQLIYAPERILIGGGISRQPRLVQDIRAAYRSLDDRFQGVFTTNAEITTCRFQNDANQYGALYRFLKQNGQI